MKKNVQYEILEKINTTEKTVLQTQEGFPIAATPEELIKYAQQNGVTLEQLERILRS